MRNIDLTNFQVATGDWPDSSRPVARSAFQEILRLAEDGHGRAVEALDRMAHFLGWGLAGLVTGLPPEVIVIVGEVTCAWNRVGPLVTDEMKRLSLHHALTRVVPTDPSTQPRPRGAVTLVVQQHFGAPTVA
jgi:predicted NBD/HSP70 family sugar kinase